VTALGVATAGDALEAATDALRAAGCETPELDAVLLIADALGVDRAAVIADRALAIDGARARVIGERVRRRSAREPVAYILGRRWFRDLELHVDGRVLIPRPESELLVEVALELTHRGAHVHDVGTGSGAVALAIKHERPDLVVSGSDRSDGALALAAANATRLGLEVALPLAEGLPAGEYDLVVANLPYVRSDEWASLAPEITRYEPRAALVAGADGLDEIRALLAETPRGTRLALEHAPGQAASVRALLEEAETRSDLGGRERVTIGLVP